MQPLHRADAPETRRAPDAPDDAEASHHDTLAASHPGPDARALTPVALVPSARLGRYVILRRLGSGGMGVVYAAYDEELDRRVALKLLHEGGADDSQGRPRAIREAQALARLSDPNVVQIYEVGEAERQVYVAMEYIDGPTLGAWLAARPRTRGEILGHYVQAGCGLAAAHAAGLVHRDFKPDNALVARDGRVRVVDFGLARSAGGPTEGQSEPTAPPGDAASLPAGTPLYMSPEQFAGQPLDGRSDQFSFCVALWEALVGRHPFARGSPEALALAVSGGVIDEVPEDGELPQTVLQALRRGLAVDPAARWPDMKALLAELSVDESRDPRAFAGVLRRLVVLLLAVVVLTSVGVITVAAAGGDPVILGVIPPATIFLGALSMVVTMRRRLLGNLHHRRIVALTMLLTGGMLLSRFEAIAFALPLQTVVLRELWLFGAVAAAASFFFMGCMMLLAAPMLLASLVIARDPATATVLGGVAYTLFSIGALILWRMSARSPRLARGLLEMTAPAAAPTDERR